MRIAPPIAAIVFSAIVVVGAVLLFSRPQKPPSEIGVVQSERQTNALSTPVVEHSAVAADAAPLTRSLPGAQEIARWKSVLDRTEDEIKVLRSTASPENQIRSDGELAESKLAEAFGRAGVNLAEYPNIVGAERLNLLRSPRLQSELLGMLKAAGTARLFWDKVHGSAEPEKWLSPVYRRTVRDWAMMDPAAFLGGRIRFTSKAEYLPYAGVDMAVQNLALSDMKPLIEWAWPRKDVVPATSCDILVQTLVVDAYNARSGEDRKFEPKLVAQLRDMATSRNPTFRLMALHLADSFESDANKLVRICERASAEVNQVFWKVALQKLETIGGPTAADAAKKFHLDTVVPSDGTAFADDADVAKECELLVRAVEARRSR